MYFDVVYVLVDVAPNGMDSERGSNPKSTIDVAKKGSTLEEKTNILAKRPPKVCPESGETNLIYFRSNTLPLATDRFKYKESVSKTVYESSAPS